MVGTFAAVPLLLDDLGLRSYGVFVVITTIPSLLAAGDLGLGSGLLTELSQALGAKRLDRAVALVSSAVAALALVAPSLALITAGGVVTLDKLGWNLVPASWSPDDTAGASVFLLVFLVGIPLSLSSRVQLAALDYRSAALWSGVSQLAPSVGAIVAALFHLQILGVLLVSGLATSTVQVLLFARVFGARHRTLRPRLACVSAREIRVLAKSGGYFALIALSTAIAFQTDTWVISKYLGSEEAASYSLVYRYFYTPVMILALAMGPIWGFFGQAMGRGDRRTVAQAFRVVVMGSVVLGGTSVSVLYVFASPIISFWTSSRVQASGFLLSSVAVLSILLCLELPLTAFMNGLGQIRQKAISVAAMAILNLPLSIYLARLLGTPGPAIASALSLLLLVHIPLWPLARRTAFSLTGADRPANRRQAIEVKTLSKQTGEVMSEGQ
jgi:O-antigen/teichoic acid export membrane protein